MAQHLNRLLANGTFCMGFSTDKDDLVLEFTLNNGQPYQLTMRFAGGEMFFTQPSHPQLPGKKCIKQFKQLEQRTIKQVRGFEGERLLSMDFEDGSNLVLKGFGRFGNVLLFENGMNKPLAIFRLGLKQDWEFDFRSLVENTKSFKGDETIDVDIYISQKQPTPALQFKTTEGYDLAAKGADGLFEFANLYLRQFHFFQRKNDLIKQLERKLSHQTKLETEYTARLHALENKRSYKEIGDLLLSYAHLIKQGVGSAFIPDYYTGNQIRVKLDPKLDAAGNAERYYKKGKNEGIEKRTLTQQLQTTKNLVVETEARLMAAKNAKTPADLRPIPTVAATKPQDTKPYREYSIDGFRIWVGKNARSNDEMLRLAAKNDLWLHVRDYPGSHVIIKKSGASFPDGIVKKAAELAVNNSKAKSHGMATVIYTERKFVSKPKNANPGEVAIMKENTLDVYLNN